MIKWLLKLTGIGLILYAAGLAAAITILPNFGEEPSGRLVGLVVIGIPLVLLGYLLYRILR